MSAPGEVTSAGNASRMGTKASSGWRAGVGGVEAGVEDGDGEAPRVEERAEVEHRGDVALERQREEHHSPPAVLLLSGHRLWSGLSTASGCRSARSADGDAELVRLMSTHIGHQLNSIVLTM